MAGAIGPLGAEELERLRAKLQAMALRALGDSEAAEEAAQETLTRAVQAVRRGQLREREKLFAFVHGIARHVITDMLRARQRRRGLEAMPEAADPAPGDALSALISAEERDRVRRALSQLSAGDREILHLSFFEDLTPAEIAQRLGEPAPRIWKRKSRALDRIRRALLGERGPGQESS